MEIEYQFSIDKEFSRRPSPVIKWKKYRVLVAMQQKSYRLSAWNPMVKYRYRLGVCTQRLILIHVHIECL